MHLKRVVEDPKAWIMELEDICNQMDETGLMTKTTNDNFMPHVMGKLPEEYKATITNWKNYHWDNASRVECKLQTNGTQERRRIQRRKSAEEDRRECPGSLETSHNPEQQKLLKKWSKKQMLPKQEGMWKLWRCKHLVKFGNGRTKNVSWCMGSSK